MFLSNGSEERKTTIFDFGYMYMAKKVFCHSYESENPVFYFSWIPHQVRDDIFGFMQEFKSRFCGGSSQVERSVKWTMFM